jgi:UBX domain-containing protein 1
MNSEGPSSTEKNAVIAEFVEISQASPDEAHELLSAANWDLENALGLYYKEEASANRRDAEPLVGGSRDLGSSRAKDQSHSQTPSKSSKPVSKRFATLADLSKNDSLESSPAHSGSEDNNDPENFFTGGEKSGLAVQVPDGAGGAGNRIINDIFRQAQRNQTRPLDDDEDDEDFDGDDEYEGTGYGARTRKSGKAKTKFVGTGFTLGTDEIASRPVEGIAPAVQEPVTTVSRRLTFWRDGFSVEDGPLYRYDDPANLAHLQDIRAGRAPLSLLNVQNGQGVDVNIVRKLDEDYTPPKRQAGGFHGSGNRLGSPVPGEVRLSRPIASPAASSSGTATPPTTQTGDAQVQIRLGDGRSLRHRFQSTGAVQQLYDHVDSHSTDSRGYVLQTTFPNRELTDRSMSLKDAGVVGAVVVQRWM